MRSNADGHQHVPLARQPQKNLILIASAATRFEKPPESWLAALVHLKEPWGISDLAPYTHILRTGLCASPVIAS